MSWLPDWWLHNFGGLLVQLQEPGFNGWLLFRYALQALAGSLPIYLADYLFGLAIVRLLKLPLSGGLRHAAALGLGAGAAGFGIFLFGVFGRLTGKGLLAFTVVEGCLGLWIARKGLRRPRWRWSYLLAFPLMALYLADLMMPVLDYDSTMYHMASAHHYMQRHKIEYHEGIRFNAQPHLPVMLYMRQWWLTQDANLTKLVNLEFLAMMFALFHWYGRRYRIPLGALAAAGLVFGSPIYNYVTRVEYADFALSAWLAVGVAVLLSSGGRWMRGRVLAAGLLIGFAASCKLQGLVVAGCFVAADTAIFLWRERSFRLSLARASLLGGGIVAMGIGWWLRAYNSTGSPFYPFLTNSPDVQSLFNVNARYGVGRDLLTLLATPWNMIVVAPETYADLLRFGPSCLIVLLTGCAAFAVRKKIDYSSAVVLLGSAAFTLLWFRSGQVMRYEACLLPLWAMLLLSALARLRWRSILPALLLVPLLVVSCALASNVVRFGVLPPVTWPATQSVLNAVLPYYRATQAAGAVVKPNERVYTWFCDDIRSYAPGKSYGDWFGAYTYAWLGNVHGEPKITEVGEMLRRLQAAGFRYIIVSRERAARGGTIYKGDFQQSGFVKRFVLVPGTETIFDDGNYAVFRLL